MTIFGGFLQIIPQSTVLCQKLLHPLKEGPPKIYRNPKYNYSFYFWQFLEASYKSSPNPPSFAKNYCTHWKKGLRKSTEIQNIIILFIFDNFWRLLTVSLPIHRPFAITLITSNFLMPSLKTPPPPRGNIGCFLYRHLRTFNFSPYLSAFPENL